MKLLEERILKDGKVRPGGILKIDSFLNHQIDPQLLYAMAEEFHRLYDGCGVNKILTVEASGIAIAAMTGYVFGCPMVFAKKGKTKNISDDVWTAEVESFTHGGVTTGSALIGLRQLCRLAGAEVVGAGIAVEKVFQGGGDHLRAEGMRVESLARIISMTDTSISF